MYEAELLVKVDGGRRFAVAEKVKRLSTQGLSVALSDQVHRLVTGSV